MAMHTDLPIYRKGVQLLDVALRVQQQMPRSMKRILGEKVTQHCVDALRTAQVYLECREPECDGLSDHGIGLGEYGSAVNSVAGAIEAHDREIFRSVTKRRRAAPTT